MLYSKPCTKIKHTFWKTLEIHGENTSFAGYAERIPIPLMRMAIVLSARKKQNKDR
jgi:hypothetical protein